MDIIRSDKSRCRPPKSEWSLDDRTDRAGSGAEWGWVGRPLRRLPRFATDGRGRMREATLHHNMDGWLGGSTNPSRSPLLVSQLASQSGKEGRERHFSGRRGRRVVCRLVCGPISFFSRKTDWPWPAVCWLLPASSGVGVPHSRREGQCFATSLEMTGPSASVSGPSKQFRPNIDFRRPISSKRQARKSRGGSSSRKRRGLYY